MELYDFLQYVFLRGMCLGGVCRQLQHFPTYWMRKGRTVITN